MAEYEIRFDGESLPLNAVDGTEQPFGMDISKLLSTTGRVTFDPGYGNGTIAAILLASLGGGGGVQLSRRWRASRKKAG